MRYVVEVDERGRLTLPKKVREKLGIKGKVLIRIREGIVEIIPLDRLRKEISELFEGKFSGWKEEDHEATKELFKLTSEDEAD